MGSTDGAIPHYEIASEHEHSCCVLLANADKFKIDNKWHTFIDFDKFLELESSGKAFSSLITWRLHQIGLFMVTMLEDLIQLKLVSVKLEIINQREILTPKPTLKLKLSMPLVVVNYW